MNGFLSDVPPGSKIETSYFGNSSKVQYPVVETTGPIAARYAGISAARMDMESSRGFFLKFLQIPFNDSSHEIHNALWIAGVVTYAKSYVTSDARKFKLNEGEIFKGMLKKYSEDHKKLLELRHEHFAHAGLLKLQQATTYFILDPFSKQRTGSLQTYGIDAKIPSPEWIFVSMEMVSFILGRLTQMLHAAELNVYKEMKIHPAKFRESLTRKINIKPPKGEVGLLRPKPRIDFY